MKYTLNTPCNECPFLNKYKDGFTFQRLTELALTEMPCHKTCEVAGAMIFLSKRKDKFLFGFNTSKLNMSADVR